jgi:hypothetical protein
MESSSPRRRRDRGGDAEDNPGLQLSLRCLGGLCASAVNSLYSWAFLKALIVNNFNLHRLQITEQAIAAQIEALDKELSPGAGTEFTLDRSFILFEWRLKSSY